jgi:hypothetical protein
MRVIIANPFRRSVSKFKRLVVVVIGSVVLIGMSVAPLPVLVLLSAAYALEVTILPMILS